MRHYRWLSLIIGLALVTACSEERENGDRDRGQEQAQAGHDQDEADHDGHDHSGHDGDDHAGHDHEGHAHAAPHGGDLTTIGDYHLEFLAGRGGAVTLYVLGKDPKVGHPISASSLTIRAVVKGTEKVIEIMLESAPTSDDTDGKSSRFMGELPIDLDGKELLLAVKVPIGDKDHSAVFEAGGEVEEEEEPEHDHNHGHGHDQG